MVDFFFDAYWPFGTVYRIDIVDAFFLEEQIRYKWGYGSKYILIGGVQRVLLL